MEMTEHDKAELQSHHAHRIETYKSMISISVEGFKYTALLNGGAAAGMIATIDKLRNAMLPGPMQIAMLLFVAGLGLNGFAIAFSYVTQMALYNESIKRLRDGQHSWPLNISVACFVGSLLAFCAGAIVAVNGLKP
ncbi:hypothetical protein [Rugamonas apoptosis]|uniref:Uncharacterized protein n=1 Tax=Rugamonas apoptosis TaxID=2758570 RepID=A0A7W2IJW7_9BURK|nr:hypothetical protein [Rugamonas apoptosis]MBA5686958.1 hypothetical protein [Rugamonas apoptosis]